MEKIAMKCTKAEYESIRKFVGELVETSDKDFHEYNYLYTWKDNDVFMYIKTGSCRVYETFNKAIFLKACGIKVSKVSKVKINLLDVEEALGKDTIVAINTRVNKDKKKSMFKKAIKIIKALDNDHCNITYIGTDSGYAINSQGDNELDGSFTITITGNETK
jgi:hypothetical protein